MPLFACSKCETIENTALGSYWMPSIKNEPVLCSECATGEWHGKFPKKKPDAGWFVYDRDKLVGPDEVERFKHMGPLHPYVPHAEKPRP